MQQCIYWRSPDILIFIFSVPYIRVSVNGVALVRAMKQLFVVKPQTLVFSKDSISLGFLSTMLSDTYYKSLSGKNKHL